MPRLTNHIYLERHRFMQTAWSDFKPIFSVIHATDQLKLHLYYQTTSTAGESELLERRRHLSTEHPSLPNRASKSFHIVYRAFRLAFEYAEGDDLRFMTAVSVLARPLGQVRSGVRVRGVVRADIDPEQLARAFLALLAHQDDDLAA